MTIKATVTRLNAAAEIVPQRVTMEAVAVRLAAVIASGQFANILKPSDTAAITDAITAQFSKAPSDAAAVSELLGIIIDYARGISDTPTAQDVLAVLTSRPLSDAASVSDSLDVLIALAQELADGASLTDAIVFAMSFVLADNPVVADAVAMTVTIPGLADSSLAQDTVILVNNKPLVETPGVTDAGLVVSQDYIDPTYFAADYIGESRTF